MEVNFVRLQILRAIVDFGSMSAAARELHVTPAAVSQQIKHLERELGHRLLDRTPNGAVPTDAGRVVVDHTRAIGRDLEAMSARLDAIVGLRAVRIGTFPTFASSVLPLAIKHFLQRFPEVEISVQSASPPDLVERLHRRQVDLALLWDVEWAPINDSRLHVDQFLDDPTVLVVPCSHRLVDIDEVRMEMLSNERWIIRGDQNPIRDVLFRSAYAAGFEPDIAFEASDYQGAQAMVSAGLGIWITPTLSTVNLRSDLRVVALHLTTPPRRVMVAHVADRQRSRTEVEMSTTLTALGPTFAQREAQAGAVSLAGAMIQNRG